MRSLRVVSGIVVSLAAFAALGVGFVWTAEATQAAASVKVVGESKGGAAVGAMAGGAEPAVEAEPEPYPLPTITEAEAPEPEPVGIVVPELTERTALRAFRQARELGLVAEIVDEDGRAVPPSERLYMRVTEQGTPAGERLAEGEAVHLTARYPRAGFASGY